MLKKDIKEIFQLLPKGYTAEDSRKYYMTSDRKWKLIELVDFLYEELQLTDSYVQVQAFLEEQMVPNKVIEKVMQLWLEKRAYMQKTALESNALPEIKNPTKEELRENCINENGEWQLGKLALLLFEYGFVDRYRSLDAECFLSKREVPNKICELVMEIWKMEQEVKKSYYDYDRKLDQKKLDMYGIEAFKRGTKLDPLE